MTNIDCFKRAVFYSTEAALILVLRILKQRKTGIAFLKPFLIMTNYQLHRKE